MNKSILVFVNGEFYKQICYNTKKLALQQYKLFNKKGILSPDTGKPIQNASFELI